MGVFASAFMGEFFGHLIDDWCGSSIKEKLQTYDVAAPLTDALDRLERVARAVCHIVNVAPKSLGATPKPAELQYITAYAGRDTMERQWKIWLTSRNQWWANECTNVLKVSGSSILLEPKVQELKAKLESEAGATENAEVISEVVDLYKQVMAGTREIVHKPLGETLLDQLTEKAQAFVKNEGAGVISTPLVDSILTGLQVFSAKPGVLSLAQKVREVATTKGETLLRKTSDS